MSKGLRQFFSPARFNAAEGVLGAVALVLVIWLLWPDGGTPKLDQKVAWQQQLMEAERRRAEEAAARQAEAPAETVPAETDADRREMASEAAEPVQKRRVLAKPSEFADRLVYEPERSSAQAAPKAKGATLAERRPGKVAGQGAEDRAIAALNDVVGALGDDHRTSSVRKADEPSTDPDEPANKIEVAVVSTEALDAAPGQFLAAPAPSSEGFDIESSASAHVRQRPRDDAPSWLKNAVAASLLDDRPVIAVVIDDLGVNRTNTKALNELPGPLTMAFLPYAGDIEAQTDAARLAGHELMVHLPMEPYGSDSPGPNALITSLDHDEFVERLALNLNRIKGYVGVNNHMGSRLTADRGRMDLVMRELRERDVLFLNSKTSPRSVAGEMASRNGVPNTNRDIFLDHVIDIDKIRRQMSLVERVARQTGSAVAIGHPHSATIEALKGWLPRLAERGFVLAPISAVVALRACNDGLLITPETCGRYLQAQKPDGSAIVAGGG